MKKDKSTVAAFAAQLDEVIAEIDRATPADHPTLLVRVNQFVNAANELIQDGTIPSDMLSELVQVQRQLILAVENYKNSRAR